LRGLGGFDGRSKFATWLARVALNTTYSFLRGRGRSPVDYRAAVPEPQGLAPPDGPALEAEQHARIEAALAGLSPKLRAAVVLVDLGGTEVKEAARIEGCTAATMYWRIHEARKRLRRKLERYVSP
jgi:RNA polymerase sigma-70 factor (ECF subfamily)